MKNIRKSNFKEATVKWKKKTQTKQTLLIWWHLYMMYFLTMEILSQETFDSLPDSQSDSKVKIWAW